ncbi:unnamed protein product [Clonostachys chloroleuca]|uniref:Dolichyl-phosphate-mannose--protein mannosyltransferase n=1 Tax=Clonostachys chloroleuca TaxID=1926264 RepID=A0AA35Q1Y2_9HYPO|nr:unnamed protein product [Clonostachys chloroleuca]
MGKSNGARGRSPQPPSEKQQQPAVAAHLQPALAVPGAPKARSKSRSKSRSKNKKKAANTISTSYKSDGVKDNDVFLLPVSDYVVALGITVLATLVRTWKIYMPTSVVFDEVHFGGFASKYIKGKFFMDVHPPLAKMLIALTGWLAGFDGSFDFKEIGKDYIEPNVPYVAMRMFPAICGILLAPIMFLTLKTVGCRTVTALLGSSFIIFENGLLTQARLILLDSPLVFATGYTALAFNAFTNQHELGPSKAFSPSWWFWLINTGLGLGITASIKWVGLFTIAWVGLLTILQLWILLGDVQNVSMRLWTKHLMARVFSLIIVPLTFYMAMFAIHFLCLVNPGEGDGFMSSEFQSTLNSKGMASVPADVVMGSKVSIRHVNTQGGYLHSHPLMYPTGSKQQQITLYPHKDENNLWFLENQTQPLGADGQPINGTNAWDLLPEPSYITDGAVLRLYHVNTHRRLHSHDVRPPVTEADWQNEVSAYGYEGFEGDANDFFRVEIVKKQSKSGAAQQRLRTIETKFRLVHVMTGCVLFSHKVKLPDWASEQQEVTCARGGSIPNSVWYIESNESPHLGADAERVNYNKPGFFSKFAEIHAVMWRTNAGLTDSHAWDSRPESWPILRRGINFWGRNNTQVYLLGNPIIWWSSSISIVVWVIFKVIAVIRWQRSCGDYSNATFKRFDYEIGTSVLGWALHYFPFYLMKRQLFLHHYFPALYFAIIALCQVIDFATFRIPASHGHASSGVIFNRITAVVFLVLSGAAFSLLSPLAYGGPWTKAQCNRVKLFPTWDFDCKNFHDSLDQYTYLTVEAGTNPTPTPSVADAVVPENDAQKPLGDAPEAKAPEVKAPEAKAPVEEVKVVAAEEQVVEYRDQNGNLLNEEQVKSLREQSAEFSTKLETETQVAEDIAKEQPQSVESEPPVVAPPHPDVEGLNSETVKNDEKVEIPQDAAASRDGEKEAEQKQAKPASEGQEATLNQEL